MGRHCEEVRLRHAGSKLKLSLSKAGYVSITGMCLVSRILPALALLLVIMNGAFASDGFIERSHYLANSFNVLAYNIYMRPSGLFADDQAERGAILPSKLH